MNVQKAKNQLKNAKKKRIKPIQNATNKKD